MMIHDPYNYNSIGYGDIYLSYNSSIVQQYYYSSTYHFLAVLYPISRRVL